MPRVERERPRQLSHLPSLGDDKPDGEECVWSFLDLRLTSCWHGIEFQPFTVGSAAQSRTAASAQIQAAGFMPNRNLTTRLLLTSASYTASVAAPPTTLMTAHFMATPNGQRTTNQPTATSTVWCRM